MSEALHRRSRWPVTLLVGLVVLALAAGGITFAALHHSTPSASRHHDATTTHASGQAHTTSAHKKGKAAAAAPLRVVSVSPSSGAQDVGFQQAITVTFSAPLGASSPLPRLRPAVAGSWERTSADQMVFRPTGNYAPFSRVTVLVPGGSHGVVSSHGARLASLYSAHFTVKPGSELRLQELLAELGYLPLSFSPSAGTPATTASARLSADITQSAPPSRAVIDEPRQPEHVSPAALPGKFAWRYASIPAPLAALWSPGRANVMTTGAVMRFEQDHGLGTDGVAGPLVWAALLKAVAGRQVNTAGYDYVWVTTSLPEQVHLWVNGRVIFQTLANTGIPQAPTALGTWPVYVRYTVTTMSGTEPNGQHYSDPGIPWVSYFHGGDALHGYLRASYGFPQSLGCVEMTFSAAKTVYPYTPIGTLVTVL